MERERKFLVSHLPQGLRKIPHRRIRQGYLSITEAQVSAPVEVRIREESGKHVLTVKAGSGHSRSEIELAIPEKIFRRLWKLTRGRRLEKTRYRIPLGSLLVELDVYHGRLRGLLTAEVEFKSERQLRAFSPPDWFGREITDRPEFGNSRLASEGKPANRKR